MAVTEKDRPAAFTIVISGIPVYKFGAKKVAPTIVPGENIAVGLPQVCHRNQLGSVFYA
jgi:hypothetical protein